MSNFRGGGRGATAMEIIVSKNCEPATWLCHGPLECLLVNEGDETGKHIFGLCFPMGPTATGRPPREPEVGEEDEKAGTAGRAGPQDTLLSWQKDEEKMKVSIHLPPHQLWLRLLPFPKTG